MSPSSSPAPSLVAGLPDELLSKVFQACNPPPRDADVIEPNCEFEDVNYDIQLLHLKQVCSKWKALVEESPLLWTHISVAFQHPEYISEALQRSKECPLVVHSAPGYSTGHSRYGERKVKSDERQADLLANLILRNLHRIRVLAVAHTVQEAVGDRLQPGDLSKATALEHFYLPTQAQLPANSPLISILCSAPNLRVVRCFGSLSRTAWEKFASVQYQSLDTLVLGENDVNRQVLPRMTTMTSLLRNLPSLEDLTLLGYDGRHESHIRAPVELPKLRKLMIVDCCHRMAYRLISNLVLPLGCQVAFIRGHGDKITDTDAPCIMDAARRISTTLGSGGPARVAFAALRGDQFVFCGFAGSYSEHCTQHLAVPLTLAPQFFEKLNWASTEKLQIPSCRHMCGGQRSDQPWSSAVEQGLVSISRTCAGVTNLTINCCFCRAQLPFLMSLIGPSAPGGSSLFPELDILHLHITPISHNQADDLEICRAEFSEALVKTIQERKASSDTPIGYLALVTPPGYTDVFSDETLAELDAILSLDIVEDWEE